jgi:hypothetical protein
LDFVFDLGRRRTGMSLASGVRRRVRVDPWRLPVVQIVDERLVAHDPGTGNLFSGRIHQSGIGRVNVVDRLVPRRLIGVHAAASSVTRNRFV